ncbi:MAG TPA: bifunctional 4-hydroxy-2-oxoglutarate aldolase/2-dehydro-3-deoxy-phosphogluconate aldolase [Vicinamibacteria bacterium]|nr:bifunctional 4-hydroxy-2-oxoglutarate aldolase/2-dehydro-3-deoxy-phosphogluconate aldolase [Vicinamibacteria bacterium]
MSHALLTPLEESRAFAVIRTDAPETAEAAGRACLRGGLRFLEITLTVPDALAVVARLAREDGAIVGVGSVTSREQVSAAARAGARFSVSPHLDSDLVAEARSRGLLASAGAVTPTEMMAAHRAGAEVIKIFPGAAFGPGYLKAIREPLPFLKLMPTGGVDEKNLTAWLEAGACAVGLGGSLLPKPAVQAGDWAAVEARARQVADLVRDWRQHRTR